MKYWEFQLFARFINVNSSKVAPSNAGNNRDMDGGALDVFEDFVIRWYKGEVSLTAASNVSRECCSLRTVGKDELYIFNAFLQTKLHYGSSCLFVDEATKKKDLLGKKKGNEGRGRTHEHWSDIISSICNQVRNKYFETKLNLSVPCPRKLPSKFGLDQCIG